MNVMARFNRNPLRRLLVMAMAATLLFSACSQTDSGGPPGEPVAQPGDANGPVVAPTLEPTPTENPTEPTPVPTRSETENPTPEPTPVLSKPAPTTVPPAVPVSRPPAVSISCTISPQRAVRPGEHLTFRAQQSPADVSVAYTFDHGDGTLDHTGVSTAYYEAPGIYPVKLRWSHAGGNGTVACGNVTVDGLLPHSDTDAVSGSIAGGHNQLYDLASAGGAAR